MNYGLVVSDRPDEKAYILGGWGSLPKIVLQMNGQWDDFLPQYEAQADRFETCGCTIYGTQNCIEILLKRLTGVEQNYSERFNYILAGISCPGTDPHYVCESIRQNKVIDQRLLPTTETYNEFCQPLPMDVELLKVGLKWPFEFKHEWVLNEFDPDWKEKMMDALRYSPLGAAVYAWKNSGEVYARPTGAKDNHWCVIYGYEKGKYWKCFDSYDHSVKHLAWNFGFTLVKRFYVSEQKEIIKGNWLIDLMKRLFHIFI